jgi:hypothetical protein
MFQSALSRDDIVPTLLKPGETLTDTMFDFWSFGLTTGTLLERSSGFGT